MKKNKRNLALSKLTRTLVFVFLIIILLAFLSIFSSSKKASWDFDWSGIRTEIRDSITSIEKKGGGFVSEGGCKGFQRKKDVKVFFFSVKDAELKKLLHYPDGFIKAMSYEALIRKGENNTFDLMKRAFNDTIAYLDIRSGCTSRDYLIGEYLIENVLYMGDDFPPPPRNISYIETLANDEIDSLLLLNNERKRSKERYILKAYEFEEKYN